MRRAQLILILLGSRRSYAYLRRAWQVLRYARRKPHEDDFAAFALFPDRTGLFLDVGASSGTSAMSFRIFNRRSSILSVEPNAVLEPELRFLRRIIAPFAYLIAAAGRENASASLFIPFFRDVPITGESSLAREEVASSPTLRDWLGDRMRSPQFRIVETPVAVRRLDDLDLSPDFVKIDVQGAELDVLQGLDATLRRSRPILLLERGTTFREVSAFLAARGYGAYTFRRDDRRFRPLAKDVATVNVFFLKHELAATLGERGAAW